MIAWMVHEVFAFLVQNMAKSAICDMTSFFYKNIFKNDTPYRKVLIEYFQKMYIFNKYYYIGHTVDEINAFEISKKALFAFFRFQMLLSRQLPLACLARFRL